MRQAEDDNADYEDLRVDHVGRHQKRESVCVNSMIQLVYIIHIPTL